MNRIAGPGKSHRFNWLSQVCAESTCRSFRKEAVVTWSRVGKTSFVLVSSAVALAGFGLISGNAATKSSLVNNSSSSFKLLSTLTTPFDPQGKLQLPDPDLVRKKKTKKHRSGGGARTVPVTKTNPRLPVEDSTSTEVVIPPAPKIVRKNEVKIGSSFGYRSDPFTRRPRFHSGVDIKARRGDPVGASHPGTVAFAGWDKGGYGNLVIVDHGGGVETYYAHLSNIKVKVGDRVARGSLVGLAGSTGRSTSPHLHYELRVAESAVNPLQTVALDPSSQFFGTQSDEFHAGQPSSGSDSPVDSRQAAKEADGFTRERFTNAGNRGPAENVKPAAFVRSGPPSIRTVEYTGDPLMIASSDFRGDGARNRPGSVQLTTEVAPPTPSSPAVVRSVVLGSVIERRQPHYPAQARLMKIGGMVEILVNVSPEGRVLTAQARSGHPLLVPAALDAARGFRWEPSLSNGVPVPSERTIQFNFSLASDPREASVGKD